MNYVVPTPCVKDCPDRSATCHAECEKYAEFVRMNELRKKGKLEALEREYIFYKQRAKRVEKKRKRKK